MTTQDNYTSPLSERYASRAMQTLFSSQTRYKTWRELWVALAMAQQQLGLPITNEQIHEMKAHIQTIDFELAYRYEKQFHHDVMAHIHAFGDQCPTAKPIIHWGATSCYVTDNADTLIMKNALELISQKLNQVIQQLSKFSLQHAELPTLAFTHLQPAQLTTVGKRAAMWAQDFIIDQEETEYRLSRIQFLGVKGATGTQASFLSLFDQDHEKVKKLEAIISEIMGFTNLIPISGQTYTRKLDHLILNALSGIAISAHKLGTDLRLLCHMKEIEEPIESSQVGSTAMPYKRNPILSERICSLSRFLISLNENPAYTAAVQWMERTLDDSANRRLTLSEAFLACDSILELLIKVTSSLVVYPNMIKRHIEEELPFMATENILMECVKRGGDRQLLHEKIRQHSHEAARRIKTEGLNNNLIELLENDPSFKLTKKELEELLNIKHFIGRAPEQVKEFFNNFQSLENKYDR